MATDSERKLQQIRKLRDLLKPFLEQNWDDYNLEILATALYEKDVRVCDEHKSLGGCVTSKIQVTTTVDNRAAGSELNTQLAAEAYELGRRRGMH